MEIREKMKQLGQYLKTRREEMKLTQNDLATQVGYDQSQIISNIERGVAKIPVAKLPDFARALNLSENKLTLDLIGLDLKPDLACRLQLLTSESINKLVQGYQAADVATREKFVNFVSQMFNVDGSVLQRELDGFQSCA